MAAAWLAGGKARVRRRARPPLSPRSTHARSPRNPAPGDRPPSSGDGGTLIYEKLPADIAERHVLLMDPILATGNSAATAVQVLLDKGVSEGRILFLTLIAAPEGVRRVCGAFPRLRLVTSEIDEGLDPATGRVNPGVGEFGDRYFCQ